MGSKPSFGTVDDSVHVMLQHDKKLARKKGKTMRLSHDAIL
jgi:hypothetical protein